MQEIKPLFDFNTNKSNILIHQSSAEISINQHTYTGNCEVRLELVPRANIYFYGYFQGVPFQDVMNVYLSQNYINNFSINGRQFQGFRLSSGGNAKSQEFNLKWCPKSEPVYGVGDESTKMSSLVFHLFNFVDLLGTPGSVQQNETGMHRIEHVDLMCDQWHVELKSLLSTREEIKNLRKKVDTV